MSRRINILSLILAFALLFCTVNLTAADTSCRNLNSLLSSDNTLQDQSLSPDAGNVSVELGTTESIRGHNNSYLFSNGSRAKGRAFQRTGLRILLLFVLVLCLLKIALRYIRGGLFLPGDAVFSSAILYFIHDKDGKK